MSAEEEVFAIFDELEASLSGHVASARASSVDVGNSVAKLTAVLDLVVLARIAFTFPNNWDEKYVMVLIRELKAVVAPVGWG